MWERNAFNAAMRSTHVGWHMCSFVHLQHSSHVVVVVEMEKWDAAKVTASP
jgi:hypothetical protein